jgi:pimeloyl-ACP methyl ester carboxylesterase
VDAGTTPTVTRQQAVDRAFRSMPERYLGADPGFRATYRIVLSDIGRTWEVTATPEAVRVRRDGTQHEPDVTIGTDAATWLALREGELSGVEAFRRRLLYARGNLDLAIGFEGLFRLPGGRMPLSRVCDVKVGRHSISTLTMGQGPDVLMIHGLGATKTSFLDTAAALSARYRVHAIDLPGFGSSSKPIGAPYDAKFFARTVCRLMDELGIERAHLVGNSMGGRVALEIGLSSPERVGGVALLCPSVAFVKRDYHQIVRLLRPELGVLPHRFRRETIAAQFWSMFADRDEIDPSMADVVCAEFQRIYGSPGARLAFLASARNIYLDRPFGRDGFYPRLRGLQPPAMFIWGTHDRLIPSRLSHHVRRWLPTAEQIVLEGCGHVPQVERSDQTNGLLERHFSRVDALGGSIGRALRAAA